MKLQTQSKGNSHASIIEGFKKASIVLNSNGYRRSADSCNDRWSHIDPDFRSPTKEPFTENEDQIIINHVIKNGECKWKQVAKQLDRRSVPAITSRWKVSLKRQEKTNKIIWKQKTKTELKKIGYSFDQDDSSFIGKRFRKENKTNGTIVAFLSAERNEGEHFWYFLHDDYDGEDFDQNDIAKCIELKDKKRKHDGNNVMKKSSSNKENKSNSNKTSKNEMHDDTDESSDLSDEKEGQIKYLDDDDASFLSFF